MRFPHTRRPLQQLRRPLMSVVMPPLLRPPLLPIVVLRLLQVAAQSPREILHRAQMSSSPASEISSER